MNSCSVGYQMNVGLPIRASRDGGSCVVALGESNDVGGLEVFDRCCKVMSRRLLSLLVLSRLRPVSTLDASRSSGRIPTIVTKSPSLLKFSPSRYPTSPPRMNMTPPINAVVGAAWEVIV